MSIRIADGKNYIPQVRELIIKYTEQLGRDLSFQHLDDELSGVEKKYTPPNGELIAAVDNDRVIGMVAYRRLTDERCEMKRLYVDPAARGLHLGDKLVKEIISYAAAAGYSEMVLDTIEPLRAAVGLYKKNGFSECEPYYDNPMDDVIYMRKKLQRDGELKNES